MARRAQVGALFAVAQQAAAAETYLLVTRMTSWDLDTHQSWLAVTLTRLASSASGSATSGHREG